VRGLLVRWLEAYQRTGGGQTLAKVECNFEPSCSEYAKQAIGQHGAIRGLVLALRRVHRCRDREATGKTSDPVPT